jgi:5''-nucleotidase/2'',3''-cyclic phosphodiesterase and related esterases
MKTIPLIISAVMILSISITVVMSAPGDQYLNLTVLSTNDIEGYLEPAKVYPEKVYLGGAAYISGYFDYVRSEAGVNNTLVLNAGDIWSPGAPDIDVVRWCVFRGLDEQR